MLDYPSSGLAGWRIYARVCDHMRKDSPSFWTQLFSAISFPLKHMETGLRSQSTFVYNVDREDPISINLDGGPRVYFPGDRITGKQLTRFAYFIRKKTKT